jgi:hypothetical protein
MEQRRPHAGDGATRGRIEQHVPGRNHSFSQPTRRRFAVIVSQGLSRGYAVSVEPATVTHKPLGFPNYRAAMAFAEELARLEGWALLDRTGSTQCLLRLS